MEFWWIKHWGSVDLPRSDRPIEIVELDGIQTYVQSKKATNGFGLLLMDLRKGSSFLSVRIEAPERE